MQDFPPNTYTETVPPHIYHPQPLKGRKLCRACLIIAKSTWHNSKNWWHKRSNWLWQPIVINSPWLYVRGWRAETTSFPSVIHSLHILPTATRTIILHTINHLRTNRCCRIRIATGDAFLRKELILLQLNLLTRERAVHHTLVHFVDSVKLRLSMKHTGSLLAGSY